MSVVKLLAVAGSALAISGCAVYPVDAGYATGAGYGGYSTGYDAGVGYAYPQPVYEPFGFGLYGARGYGGRGYSGYAHPRHGPGQGGFWSGNHGGHGGHGGLGGNGRNGGGHAGGHGGGPGGGRH